MDFLTHPWPWYIAGPLIGLTVPTLLILGNKTFGISSSLRHICASCIPAGIPFFNYEWKKELWNLFFVLGVFIGGFISLKFLQNPNEIVLAESLKTYLLAHNITNFSSLMPVEIFSFEHISSIRTLIFTVLGGFLVGFGTRYAGGCTSGHTIMGLSNLQWPSLVATICFMIGGFVGAWFLVPFILNL